MPLVVSLWQLLYSMYVHITVYYTEGLPILVLLSKKFYNIVSLLLSRRQKMSRAYINYQEKFDF